MVLFEISLLVIGIVGASANGLMLFTLARSKSKIEGIKLVLNQMTLDFICCLLLVVTYATKLSGVESTGVAGEFLCKVIVNEPVLFGFLNCSTANLVVLTLERYTKIVHSLFYRMRMRPWMHRLAILLTWVNFVAIVSIATNLLTSESDIVSGSCRSFVRWPNSSYSIGYAVYNLVITFLLPLVILVYCYSRILRVAGGRQAKVIPVNFNNMMKSAAQQNAMKTQMNIIKTFLIVSICYVLCWFPNRLYFLLYNIRILRSLNTELRYFTMFLAFLNVCLNPFIYAAKLDPVKKRLRQKFCWRQRRNIEETNASTAVNVIGPGSTVLPMTPSS